MRSVSLSVSVSVQGETAEVTFGVFGFGLEASMSASMSSGMKNIALPI